MTVSSCAYNPDRDECHINVEDTKTFCHRHTHHLSSCYFLACDFWFPVTPQKADHSSAATTHPVSDTCQRIWLHQSAERGSGFLVLTLLTRPFPLQPSAKPSKVTSMEDSAKKQKTRSFHFHRFLSFPRDETQPDTHQQTQDGHLIISTWLLFITFLVRLENV